MLLFLEGERRPKDVTGGGGGKNLGWGPRIFPAGRTPGDFTGVFSIENFVKVKLPAFTNPRLLKTLSGYKIIVNGAVPKLKFWNSLNEPISKSG
jgi:hypothetical protein